MSTLPVPILGYLTPEVKLQPPDGFTLIDEPITSGLPFSLQLEADTRLVLTMPSGLAVTWRDSDPVAVVSRSDDDLTPLTPPTVAEPIGNLTQPPVRLLMERAGVMVASVPLAAGLRRILPDSGQPDRGGRIELAVLAWDLRAGSLRGSGDFGSRITLAWRRADEAVMQFSTPPVNPHLVPRLVQTIPPHLRIESIYWRFGQLRLDRFRLKKVILP
jgi:hypothetical protein